MSLGTILEIILAIWALIVIPRAIWRAWTRPAPLDHAPPVEDRTDRGDRWSLRGELARLFLVEDTTPIMSSDRDRTSIYDAGVGQVRHQVSAPVSVSAEPNTADTEPVSGVEIDTSARDIIRAAMIAELLDSGLLTNRDKAICQVFKCSKAASTRPDAPFQVALRLVEQHRAKLGPEYVVLDENRRPAELSKAEH